MKYMCLGYLDETQWNALSDSERNALMDECFAYDDVLREGGHFVGPGVLAGWPNRLLIVSYCAWLITAALACGPAAGGAALGLLGRTSSPA